MLTARSTASSPLDIIRLTLEMLSQGHTVPASLSEHFDSVLSSAKKLTQDPSNPPSRTPVEAIHLAFELLSRQALRQELADINGLRDLDKNRASRLLAEMELSPVHP